MSGGLAQRSRVLQHVDVEYRTRQEAFNRTCHSDALRELQLPPAETMQPGLDDAPPTPRQVLATVGWRRIAIAAAFAVVMWTATAAFAIMCGGAR